MSNSPFFDYANATLIFTITGEEFEVDIDTGNEIPITSQIRVRAMLREDTRPDVVNQVGVDETDLPIVARLTDPMKLPPEVQQLARAEVEFDDGQTGNITLIYPVQSPWGVHEILGDKIRGVWRRQT